MTHWLLSSAILNNPGTYTYRIIGEHEATDWLQSNRFASRINPESANILSETTGINVSPGAGFVDMWPGDEALVFWLDEESNCNFCILERIDKAR